MLPFTTGITGYYTEENDSLSLDLYCLRDLQIKTFRVKDQTVINTIKSEFSPILEDYLGDNVPGFSDAFMEMQSHPIPFESEEREFEIFGGVKMKFCWIPAGKATLGSPEGKEERKYKKIEHEFETNGFWMAKYPVTQSQWKAVMNWNPSWFNGNNLPVECVSWNDCQDFIKKCSVPGLNPKLPHEDQWEYACRGGKGNKQAFYWGDALNGDKANCAGGFPYRTNKKGEYLKKTTEVGSYEKVAPHPWGLCDMSGNVMEWCENLYDKDELNRVRRGGCWMSFPRCCCSSFRFRGNPTTRGSNVGFRLIIC